MHVHIGSTFQIMRCLATLILVVCGTTATHRRCTPEDADILMALWGQISGLTSSGDKVDVTRPAAGSFAQYVLQIIVVNLTRDGFFIVCSIPPKDK